MPRPPRDADAVVVGGGFYGARIAAFLARRVGTVVLLERDGSLLTRASYNNQARVHGGYHYPRSILTSRRSRANYPRFLADYAAAIDRSFTKLYAIARRPSKVTPAQFAEFCRRIGAPLVPAGAELVRRFDAEQVEAVFAVEECAFNATALAAAAASTLLAAWVSVCTGVNVRAVAPGGARRLRVHWSATTDVMTRARTDAEGHAATSVGTDAEASTTLDADLVVACTYSALNDLLADSGLPTVPLVHELTELALVEAPAALRGFGVTVMDGPFWSCMPFPAEQVHSLSHVRYTPHSRWPDGGGDGHAVRGDEVMRQLPVSHAPHMQRDAARYLPELGAARYLRSLWEVKTILPRSDVDDSRPILVRAVDGAPGLLAVLGAKIDNVYDVEEALAQMLDRGEVQ
jgi:glycine/D-amino acid oxidase-like deaminating enzyme